MGGGENAGIGRTKTFQSFSGNTFVLPSVSGPHPKIEPVFQFDDSRFLISISGIRFIVGREVKIGLDEGLSVIFGNQAGRIEGIVDPVAVFLCGDPRGRNHDPSVGKPYHTIVVHNIVGGGHVKGAPFRPKGFSVRRNEPSHRCGEIIFFDHKIKSQIPVFLHQRGHAHNILRSEILFSVGNNPRFRPGFAFVIGSNQRNVAGGMIVKTVPA